MQQLDSLWSPHSVSSISSLTPTFMALGKFRRLASSLMTNNTCISVALFFLFPYLSNGRAQPWLSPFPSPLLTGQVQPISPIPSPVAPSPIDMQVVVVAQHHHLSKEVIIGISLCSVSITVIALFAIFAWIFWRRNHKDNGSKAIQASDYATKGQSLAPIFGKLNSLKIVSKKGLVAAMDYSSLELATNNFSENNVLGEGEMSCVYKACFDGGIVAAVKKLDGSGQDHERRFDSELDSLGRIRHPNIVSLLGYCIHGESKFLVYELLQNGSLETLLHGPSHGSALTWHMRMKIALDIARGLEYLHESCNPPVIHRDLVSSNILLDAELNAKISDFGLAVCGGDQNKASFKLSGTLCHVAPEYVLDGKLSEKSDVYAFGVILLELLMGREPVEKMAPSQFQSIVTWAMPQLTDRLKLPNIVDPLIRDTMNTKHLYQVAAVAVLCVQPEPCYRPLITDVLHSLVPLVPVELGGTLRVAERSPHAN